MITSFHPSHRISLPENLNNPLAHLPNHPPRHGGCCLNPSDTDSTSTLREALLAAGVDVELDGSSHKSSIIQDARAGQSVRVPADTGDDGVDGDDDSGDHNNDDDPSLSACYRITSTSSTPSRGGGSCSGGRGDSLSVPQHSSLPSSSHQWRRRRDRQHLMRCFVVSTHGEWDALPPPPPLPDSSGGRVEGRGNSRSSSSGGGGTCSRCGLRRLAVGNKRDGDDRGRGADEDEDAAAVPSCSCSPCSLLLPAKRELWTTLEVHVGAEVVSLLWLEACQRAREILSPGSCEPVFRPRPWPIRSFDMQATAGGAFKVAVTGFVGGERTGWEQLISGGMGAELCKSLRRRFTTHLVCKEVRGLGQGEKRQPPLFMSVCPFVDHWQVKRGCIRCHRQLHAPFRRGSFCSWRGHSSRQRTFSLVFSLSVLRL